jgi:hypothetical protein
MDNEVVRILFEADGKVYIADSEKEDVPDEENVAKAVQKFINSAGSTRAMTCSRLIFGLRQVKLQTTILNMENLSSIELLEAAVMPRNTETQGSEVKEAEPTDKKFPKTGAK